MIGMSSSAAARDSKVGSPVGSAAVTSSSRCVSAGSSATCRRKLASNWLRKPPGTPNPPARSPDENICGSSSSASGLPRVSAMIRSRTGWASGPACVAARSSRASESDNPWRRSSGRPARSSGSVLIALREQNEHGLRLEAPRHEGEHLGRGAIQPLGVVHQADEWLCFGCVATAGSAPPGRRGSARAAGRSSDRRPCQAPRAGASAATRGRPAAARKADAEPRTSSSISDSTPTARTTRAPSARSAA